jgi:hypothetical protein
MLGQHVANPTTIGRGHTCEVRVCLCSGLCRFSPFHSLSVSSESSNCDFHCDASVRPAHNNIQLYKECHFTTVQIYVCFNKLLLLSAEIGVKSATHLLLGLFFDSVCGGNTFLRNVCLFPNYRTLQPRRSYSPKSSPWYNLKCTILPRWYIIWHFGWVSNIIKICLWDSEAILRNPNVLINNFFKLRDASMSKWLTNSIHRKAKVLH